MTGGGRRLALLGLGLAALALRPQLVGLGPLLPRIQQDLGISHAVAGLLPAIPIVCMGLFAPPAPYLARRVGTRTGLALCLAVIAVFGFLRAGAPGVALVVALTFPIGVGMGFAGTLLPIAVKERFPHRPVLATGVYATGIALGSAIAAIAAVPLADALGGWRGALAAYSGLAAALVAVWLRLSRGGAAHVRVPERPPRLPWHSGIGWALVVLYGLNSLVFYGISSWLPAAYVERGWSDAAAGNLLAAMQLANLPASLAVPFLADRHGSRRLFLVVAASVLLGSTLGLVLLPGGAWLWAVTAGAAIGAFFPIMLTLPLDLAEGPADVGALAALMLLGGYVISALGPLGLGAARDATGSFTVALWVLVVLSGLLIVACLPFSRARLDRGVGAAAR